MEDLVTKQEIGNDENGEDGVEKEHQMAIQFVERHREFFEHYARSGIKVLPAPKGLDTFAFDLNKNVIYFNDRFYRESGLSEDQTAFAVCHEIEHFLEKIEMLNEEMGDRKFDMYLDRIKRDRAFALVDNCVADIRENRAVVERNNQILREVERNLYKENLFKEIDLSKPKHIQFAQAILAEHRAQQTYEVSPEVRQKLDEFYALKDQDGERYIDIITHPGVPMSTRLELQDEFIMPIIEDLKKQDLEEAKEKRDQNKKENSGAGSNQVGDNQNGEPDPNDVFAEDYKEAESRIPNAVPIEDIEKAFKVWQESHKESEASKVDRQYAERLGVKKENLETYRKIVKSLEDVCDLQTNESVIDELEQLWRRIISKRRKQYQAPQYPLVEGEDLVDPAQLVADARAGNFESKAWESIEIKEKSGNLSGEVEVTLVCDKSDSMNSPSSKRLEQRRAVVLMMEMLSRFAQISDEEAVNLIKPLEVRSEVYAFEQDPEKDNKPLKKMSKELGEKERIEVMSAVSIAPGGTTDFVPLETIDQGLTSEILQKIKDGELKKIVIVFTDGESNDKVRVQKVLISLRSKGVVAIGVGITESGKPALETYAPDARLAKVAEDLVKVLTELLKEHLSGL